MELRHLRSFVVVAEELHFGRAAARLGIEQSPLSRQIQELEADLKVRLFNRTRRATTLTQSGQRFIADARRILTDVDQSVRSLRVYAATGQSVRLGLAEGYAGPPFGRLLKFCRAAAPEIAVVVTEKPFAVLVDLLLHGGLDAILGPVPGTSPDLESVPAWREPVVVLMPPEEGATSAAWLRSLADRAWIMPDPHALPAAWRTMETLLTRKELNSRADVTAATPAALTYFVAAGAGVGMLPQSLALRLDGVTIQPLRDTDAIATTWLTVLRGDCPSLRRFRDLVEEVARDAQPPATA